MRWRLELRLGRIEPFGPQGEPSAIRKRLVDGPQRVTPLGLAGDEHADLRHHGGPDKALHLYPREHYAAWRRELPGQAAAFEAGGFGENLSTAGFLETDACIGDLYRLGGAVIQVSQGRSPCWKLGMRFGVPDMVQLTLLSGRTGWYFRVIEEGEVVPGDDLTLIGRTQPDWPISRVLRVLFVEPSIAELEVLVGLEPLSANWRERAGKRMAEVKTAPG